MAVLVTGEAGFIASHLVGEQLKRWYKAIILDDLSTGRPRKDKTAYSAILAF